MEQSIPNHSAFWRSPDHRPTVQLESHTHPNILSSSQVIPVGLPTYVVAAESGNAFVIDAIRFIDTHVPCPEHSPVVAVGQGKR